MAQESAVFSARLTVHILSMGYVRAHKLLPDMRGMSFYHTVLESVRCKDCLG